MVSDATPIGVTGAYVFDPELGVYTIYMSVARRDSVFVKLMVESYEGIGITRSLDPFYEGGPGDCEARGLMVLLAVADAVEAVGLLIEELVAECGLRLVEPSAEDIALFRTNLLGELDFSGA